MDNSFCEVEATYDKACELASLKVEKIARQILLEHKELGEFVMGMGHYCFNYRSKEREGEILHPYKLKMNKKWEYYEEDSEPFLAPLNNFMSKWDNLLKISGEGMRFTASGPKITKW